VLFSLNLSFFGTFLFLKNFYTVKYVLDYVGLGMYREWKKVEFPKGYYIWIWEQQDWEVDEEIDGRW